jgi:fibronectin-binding autotransporter adhesin
MKKLIVIGLWASMAAIAVADTSWTNAGTGSWGTSGNWNNGVPSDAGSGNILIQNGGTAQIDTNCGSVTTFSYLKVGTSTGVGDLGVVTGGSLTLAAITRVGDDATGSVLTISGGSLTINDRLRLAVTSDAGQIAGGSLVISGGTLTLGGTNGNLTMGYGSGTMTASMEIGGSTPTISATRLIMTSGATKTLTYKLDASGVSKIQVTSSDNITINSTTLNVSCTAVLNMLDGSSVTLIDNQGTGTITDTFSGLAEGTTVSTTYGSYTYSWTITYVGGTGNDVVLKDLVISGPIEVTLRDATDFLYHDNRQLRACEEYRQRRHGCRPLGEWY